MTTATLIVGLVGMYTAGRIADAGVSPAWVFLAGGALQIPFLVAIGYVGGTVLVDVMRPITVAPTGIIAFIAGSVATVWIIRCALAAEA